MCRGGTGRHSVIGWLDATAGRCAGGPPFILRDGDAVAIVTGTRAIPCGSRAGKPAADAERCKAILAAEIIKTLDKERLTVRAAHDRTGIAAADFSRIRKADLGRFTVDRLMSVLNRLGWICPMQPIQEWVAWSHHDRCSVDGDHSVNARRLPPQAACR